MDFPPVTIPHTEIRSFSSAIIDQEFRIYIALPHNYRASNNSFPVLYLSDANGIFGLVTETVRFLQLFQEVPEMVIVGIGYPVEDFLDTLGLRVRDLTPTKIMSGLKRIQIWCRAAWQLTVQAGPIIFSNLSKKNYGHFIEANYRIDSKDSAILGHSFGGLFGLYTLLNAPNTFNRYIISSPSIWWDQEAVFAYEENFAKMHSDLPANVFLSAGSIERSLEIPIRVVQARFVTRMQAMAGKLQSRGYGNIPLTSHVFEDESHISGAPGAISRGLKVVFDG